MKSIMVCMFMHFINRVENYKIERCLAADLNNNTNRSGFRLECKSDASTKICRISEKFPDGSTMYCIFNKTYINEEWFQGYNLIKSECSGDKSHRFLLRIEHGEVMGDKNCILDINNVDISGI